MEGVPGAGREGGLFAHTAIKPSDEVMTFLGKGGRSEVKARDNAISVGAPGTKGAGQGEFYVVTRMSDLHH